jgi:hypothetical protein
MRRCLLNLLLVWLSSSVCVAGDSRDDLIEEIIAGSDANSVAVTEGTWTYRVNSSQQSSEAGIERLVELYPLGDRRDEFRKQLQAGPTTRVETVKLYLAPDLLRYDVSDDLGGDDREILRNGQCLSFSANWLGTESQYNARDYSVMITSPEHKSFPNIHPLHTGLNSHKSLFSSMADVARGRRNDMERCSFQRDGDRIVMILTDQIKSWQGRYVIDPAHGYLVSDIEEILTDTGEVLEWRKSEFQQNAAAGWFVSRQDSGRNGRVLDDNGKPVPGTKSEKHSELISFAEGPVDESVFTIEGLGLPIGGMIQDRINDKMYHYGVDADPSESFDETEWVATGPKPVSRGWLWLGLGTVAGAVVVCLAFVVTRRRSA